MRTIQKQISLEPMTSRLPSIWPAYLDNELYFFDDDALKDREYDHTSNYGMVPMNVCVSPRPNTNTMAEDYSVGCDFILSWYSLVKWYYFFTEYYNLLKQYGHCNRIYTSAEDYYNYESGDKYADQMVYGSDKQTYLDLDKEFADKGGIVLVKIYNKHTSEYIDNKKPSEVHDENDGDETAIVDVKDGGFFKWICENVVPSFDIPMEYVDYWKTKKLYYPDVVKWLAWFKPRVDMYQGVLKEGENGEVDTWDCKKTDDCCDCDEYFKRGDGRMFSAMTEWYENVKSLKSGEEEECMVPNIILPTELQISVEDLGEQSIFSTDYELGKDYRGVEVKGNKDAEGNITSTSIDFLSNNTNSGTIATMDGKAMFFSGSTDDDYKKGFSFDEVYMEKWVSKCNTCEYQGVFSHVCPKCGSKDITVNGWQSYTEKYINDNGNDFKPSVKYYTFNEDNVKFTTSAETNPKSTLRESLAKKYPITTRDKGWYLIDGELYEINEIEYAVYNDSTNKYIDGKKFIIYRDKSTNTPYTYINGNEVYAEFYPPTNKFYFTFFKKKQPIEDCSGKIFNIKNYITFDRFTKSDTMDYIEYDGMVLPEEEINGTVGNLTVYRILGYAINELSETMYCTNDGLIVNSSMKQYEDARLGKDDEGNDIIIIDYTKEFTVYSIDEITGKTTSKISDLRLYDLLIDDIGNTIDGIYSMKVEKKNHQPSEGEELDLIYQVGNTANIYRFSMSEDDVDKITNSENLFVGDIITRMKYYYKDVSGNVVEDTIRDVVLTPSDKIEIRDKDEIPTVTVDSTEYTSLSAITASTEVKVKIEEDNKCDEYDNDGNLTGQCIQFIEDIYCDITYYKGATLSRKENKNFNLASGMDYGVEYTETVRFVKENREYYLKKPKKISLLAPFKRKNVENHSISYPINVYKLTQEESDVNDSQYDTYYKVPMADFRFNINLMDGNVTNDMDKYNGVETYPTFMEEYRIGSSVIENLDIDIYIERGINSAYERHLKLGEVTTLEALENYSNGFFKMMES